MLCAIVTCTKRKACVNGLLGTLHTLLVICMKLYLKGNSIQFQGNKASIYSCLNKNASKMLYIEKSFIKTCSKSEHKPFVEEIKYYLHLAN